MLGGTLLVFISAVLSMQAETATSSDTVEKTGHGWKNCHLCARIKNRPKPECLDNKQDHHFCARIKKRPEPVCQDNKNTTISVPR